MKKKVFLILPVIVCLFISLSLLSCKKKTCSAKCEVHTISDCGEDVSKTNIRIKNISDYYLCNVVLNPYNKETNCGALNPMETTCYRAYDIAYSYAYVQIHIGEKEFIMQPIDFVGEQPLGVGRFTYLVDIADFNDPYSIRITVQKD